MLLSRGERWGPFSFPRLALPPTVRSYEPDKLVAGDTWTWTRYFSRFPTTDVPPWTIQYFAVGPTALAWFAFVNPTNGNSWLVSQPPGFSASALPGTYQWVTKASRTNPNLAQTPATSPVFWQPIATTAYNSGNTYPAGVYVTFGGSAYLSLVVGNTGNTPSSSPGSWGVVASTVWSALTTYTPAVYATDVNAILYLALAGTETYDAASGVFTVIPNYSTAPAAKSYNQQMLENFQALVLARSQQDVSEYSVYGRRMVHEEILRLQGLVAIYEYKVDKERRPGRTAMVSKLRFGGGGWVGPRGGLREGGI